MMKRAGKNIGFYQWLLVVFLLLFGQASAQNHYGVGMGSAYLQPVGSLQNWFKGTSKAPQVSFIFNRTAEAHWQFFATAAHFDQPNKEKLYYKDLQLDLKLYGAGVAYVSYLSVPRWRLQPFWKGAVTLFRWEAVRGAYQTEDRLVPQRFQQAWSFAAYGGLGMAFHVTRSLKLNVCGGYQLVVAELWPALALHLENVSGLQIMRFEMGFQWMF
ncbi:hypothetical protein ACX8XN_10365 [Calditrichota bacterium GD2]